MLTFNSKSICPHNKWSNHPANCSNKQTKKQTNTSSHPWFLSFSYSHHTVKQSWVIHLKNITHFSPLAISIGTLVQTTIVCCLDPYYRQPISHPVPFWSSTLPTLWDWFFYKISHVVSSLYSKTSSSCLVRSIKARGLQFLMWSAPALSQIFSLSP